MKQLKLLPSLTDLSFLVARSLFLKHALRLHAKAAAAVTALKDAHVLADDDQVDFTLLIDVVKATYEDFKPFIDQN